MSKRIKFSIEKPKYYIHSDWRFSDGCLFSGLCGLFTPSLFATFLLSALLRLLQFNRICIPPLSTAAFVNQTRERAALQTAVLISFVHNTSLPPLQPLRCRHQSWSFSARFMDHQTQQLPDDRSNLSSR